jgi:hypothetical protein
MINLLSILTGELESEDRCFHPQTDNKELGRRPKAQFSIEYLIDIEYGQGELQRETTGEIFGKTNSSVAYELKGIVHFKLKDENSESEDKRLGNYHHPCLDYKVQVELYKGEQYSSRIKINEEGDPKPLARVTLSKVELEKFCQEHFEHMSMFGKIKIATIEPFPPNLSREEIAGMLLSQLSQSNEFKKYSDFHKKVVSELYN